MNSPKLKEMSRYFPKRKQDLNSSESLYRRSLDVIIKDFNNLCPCASLKSPALFLKILNEVSIQNVDHYIGAEFIHSECFYRKAARERFGDGKCIVGSHGISWKRLFYEMMLAEMLAKVHKTSGSKNDLIGMIQVLQDYIFTLKLQLNMIDYLLVTVFKALPNLTTVILKNDRDETVSNTDDSEYQINQFGRALQNTICLCSLTLSKCNLDDGLVKKFALALGSDTRCCSIRHTLIYLDISHNRLTGEGLKYLVDYFLPNDISRDENKHTITTDSVLINLDISDNNIKLDGGRIMGSILSRNSSLVYLNINLNFLGDDGGKLLLEGLKRNETLQNLKIASNSLASQSMASLSGVIEATENEICKSNLEEVDLCSNDFSDADIVKLAKAVQKNDKLLALDTRYQAGVTTQSLLVQSAIKSIEKSLVKNNQQYKGR